MRDRKRVSGAVPYGYYRKPEDKQTLYVDEVSASVVRRIFQFACEGMGATAIADTLSEDKVLIPSAYARQSHPEDCQCTNYHDPYTWNATTVGYILSRLAYINSQSKDGKTYDCNQAFRCSRYHNKYHSCTGHYIKASTVEMLIYQATKRVSQYVLNDEKEFVEQLKAQYEIQCEKDNSNEKRELLEAKRRMQYSILIYFISEKGLENCF